jgi:murein DD-endopeptidase MepM/ murein hydrolase activator NlpD
MGQVQKLVLLLAAVWLSGCMPDSPRTALEWGVNDTLPRSVATRESAKTYTYKEKTGSADKASYQDKDLRAAPRSAATVSHNTLAPISSQQLPPVGGAPAFAWPVSGRLISDFGATANGGKNDGINIAATMDAPIRASAAGTVTYAGDALKNYGNLVLVKHSGGYTTAYAHAGRLLVARGDFVTQGQVIGYVGQTGDVSSPQLHFEIRSATTPVNPRSYLSSNMASN